MLFKKEICSKLTDVEIIKKSLLNVDFFACLFERYEPKLLNYIKKLAFATNEEAEDILQEAFIKIWRNLNEYDDNLKLSSWLYRIVHNETISYSRKKYSFGKNKTQNIENINIENIYETNYQEKDTEKEFLMTNEILVKLPLKYREILILKFYEKMTYEEISDVLKIPEGTVAVRINRAKKSFKNIADKEQISFNR